jgi:protein tyrosine/serine phosphatase
VKVLEQRNSIKNFRQVNDWLYRGGQPKEAEFDELLTLGVKTVISLRWNIAVILQERSLAQQKALNFVSIPLSYWVLPTRKEIDRFLAILDEPSLRPVFVHCLHGVDRTGALIAMYRMARENWTADQAYDEMKQAGFHKVRVHQFKWAVYGFARRLARQKEAQAQASGFQSGLKPSE